MPQPCRPAGFAQKTKPRRFVTETSLADDFQCHGAVQIDVDRLVSNPHCTATQLDRFPVFARHQLIVLKSLHRLFRRRLVRILRRRLAGFNPANKSLAKHADWTEFHRSRKLVTATRASAFGLSGAEMIGLDQAFVVLIAECQSPDQKSQERVQLKKCRSWLGSKTRNKGCYWCAKLW